MLASLARRLIFVVPIALGVSIIVFSLVHLAPGDPISAIAPPNAPPSVIAQLRHDYGYDRSLPVQYWLWLRRAATGDLGTSVATGQNVLTMVTSAFRNTLLLAIASSVVGFSVGLMLGFLAGWFERGWPDRLASLTALIGLSVPNYWLGILLVIVFSVKLGALPAMGMGGNGAGWQWNIEHLRSMIMPVMAMSAIPAGIVMRSVRAAVAETVRSEFVEALRARGLKERTVVLHVARNVAPVALAVTGLQFGYLLGGSILVETVFAWPGTGLLLNNAIFRRDLPVLQGTVLLLAMIFVVLNAVVDVLQVFADPRIRRG